MNNDETTGLLFIYLLHHPSSAHVYIGKTSQGMLRPQQHSFLSELKRYAHLPRSKWVKSLHKRGVEPEIVVLEECTTVEDLDEAERFHIAYFRAIGVSLLNCTDGGDGVVGYQHTDKVRAQMSEKRKARVETIPGERERLVALSNDYWADDAAREKQRVARTGKRWSAETRAKMSASAKGKPKSDAHRAKLSTSMSVAMKLRWQDPAYQEQQREIQRAVSRQKGEAVKRLWEDPEYRANQMAKRRRKKPDDSPE